MKTVIPVIVEPRTEDYFWSNAVLDGIKQAATHYNCEWQHTTVDNISKLLPLKVPVILSGHTSSWLLNTADILNREGFTPIITNASIPTLPCNRYSGVCFDLESGIEEMVAYCVNSGRKRVALMGIKNDSAADRVKLDAFKKSAVRHNINPELVYAFEQTMEASLENFVSAVFERDIDAVICANDTVAFFLCEKLKACGIKVPSNVFVLGMGDFAVGRLCEKPLSSLGFDYRELGLQAVRLWRYFQRDGSSVNMTVSVSCTLNLRSTTGIMPPAESSDTVETVYTPTDGIYDGFFGDTRAEALLKLEAVLIDSDKLDLELLKAVKDNVPDEKAAERIGLTPRAIRYRLSKITKKLGLTARSDIQKLLDDFNIFCGGNDL